MPGEILSGSGSNRIWIVLGVIALVALLGLWKLGSGRGESVDERSLLSPKASKVQDAVAPVAPSEAQRPRGAIVAGLEGQGRGTLRVESQPPGAQIYLDGIQTGKKTPASLSVAVGLEHVILLELDGYAPGIERFQGEAAGKVNLSLPRSQKTLEGRRTVRFETKPAGASVIINGYPMQAKTPMAASLLVWTYSDIDIELGKKRRELKVRPVNDCDLTIFVKLD